MESAKVEAKLVEKVLAADKYNKSHCIQIIEHFYFSKGEPIIMRLFLNY